MHKSELLEEEVAEDVLVAVVPVELPLVLGDALDLLEHELHDVLEGAIENTDERTSWQHLAAASSMGTCLLPDGKPKGLMLPVLVAPNNISTGATL